MQFIWNFIYISLTKINLLGHDTTAAGSSFFLSLMGVHQHIQVSIILVIVFLICNRNGFICLPGQGGRRIRPDLRRFGQTSNIPGYLRNEIFGALYDGDSKNVSTSPADCPSNA